jgi:hypothetical protein
MIVSNVVILNAAAEAIRESAAALRKMAEDEASLPGEVYGPRFAVVLENEALQSFVFNGVEKFLKGFPFLTVLGGVRLGIIVVKIDEKAFEKEISTRWETEEIRKALMAEEIRKAWEFDCYGAIFYITEVSGLLGCTMAKNIRAEDYRLKAEILANDEARILLANEAATVSNLVEF